MPTAINVEALLFSIEEESKELEEPLLLSKAFRESKGFQVFKGSRAFQVFEESKEFQAFRESKEFKEFEESRDLQGLKESREFGECLEFFKTLLAEDLLSSIEHPKELEESLLLSKAFKESKEFKEFQEFPEFPEFLEFQESRGLLGLTEAGEFKEFFQEFFKVQLAEYRLFAKSFPIYKEFGEFKEFKVFKAFTELSFLVYYPDFKLLLCSACFQAINPPNFKGHLERHFAPSYNRGREKEGKVREALALLSKLEVASLQESYSLIISFSKHFTLLPFQELKIVEDIFACSCSRYCNTLKQSKRYIRKHIKEEHPSTPLEDLESSYIVIRKAQSLEPTRFFFKVEEKEKGKARAAIPSIVEEEEEEEEEEGDKEEDLFKQASSLFIQEVQSKRDAINNKSNSFTLNPNEKLTPFQMKTKYIEFLSSRDLSQLSSLVSPISKEEEELSILNTSLQEVLYLSLEKSTFLIRIHLNILNSFEKNKVRNKGFTPLVNSLS